MTETLTATCPRCGGAGTHEATPPEYNTDKYAQWLQGWRPKPVPCKICKTTGTAVNHIALRAARVAAGLSLSEFASLARVAYTYASNIECGRVRCPPKVLVTYQGLTPLPSVERPGGLKEPQELRAARVAAGLSMSEFASQAKITYSYICNIELGRVKCPPAVLSLYNALSGGKVE